MRFMLLIKSDAATDAGALPSEQELAAMGRFNEELVNSGTLLAGEGLQSSAKGAKVTFTGGQSTVTDGPFAEAKELIAGYWVIKVDSRAEAVEWARRVPLQEGEIEVRQVFDIEDFGAAATPELREAEQRLRDQAAERQG